MDNKKQAGIHRVHKHHLHYSLLSLNQVSGMLSVTAGGEMYNVTALTRRDLLKLLEATQLCQPLEEGPPPCVQCVVEGVVLLDHDGRLLVYHCLKSL